MPHVMSCHMADSSKVTAHEMSHVMSNVTSTTRQAAVKVLLRLPGLIYESHQYIYDRVQERATNGLTIFRQMFCQQVLCFPHSVLIVLSRLCASAVLTNTSSSS